MSRLDGLPPAPDGMIWLRIATLVPVPSEGGWDALPAQQRWEIDATVKDAVRDAYSGHPAPRAVAELGGVA